MLMHFKTTTSGPRNGGYIICSLYLPVHRKAIKSNQISHSVKMIASLALLISATATVAAGFPTPAETQFGLVQARQAPTTAHTVPTSVPTGDFTTTNYITIDGVTNSHVTLPAQTIELVLPTCIQTIAPDENGYVPPGTCGAIWAYYPSFVVAVIFSCLFGALLLLHTWQAIKYKNVRQYSFYVRFND